MTNQAVSLCVIIVALISITVMLTNRHLTAPVMLGAIINMLVQRANLNGAFQ